MGDIIFGVLTVILILGVLGLYRFFTRKRIEQRSFTMFLAILLVLGGLVGLLVTSLNRRWYEDHPYTFVLVLLFFIMQSSGGVLYYKRVKVALPLLVFTLLLQIPIVHGSDFSYRSQTLLSFNVDNYPKKIFDAEPGSYVHFVHFESGSSNEKSGLGINLIPLLIIFIYWKKSRQEELNREAR